ncbi:MAG TPA: cupin [Candidatus Saccharibacteria bacterium]|jgi:mannose-6-phosphate isomerase|nr:mannose-6-phosphate isomerase [Patescibacteria group bacterium]HMS31183.1 cupin [Candidatus Saccharibacteria bacterium]
MNDLPTFDTTSFSVDSYAKRIEKPWGYEIHWVPEDAPYMGKVLHVNAGAQLSLQIHDQKQESWFVMDGDAVVVWEDNKGVLVETRLEPGKGYSTKIGQRHRLRGVTDCDILEVSTREVGTTWRLEDDYARPHETPEQRQLERQ